VPPTVEASRNATMGGKVDKTTTKDEDHVKKKNHKALIFKLNWAIQKVKRGSLSNDKIIRLNPHCNPQCNEKINKINKKFRCTIVCLEYKKLNAKEYIQIRPIGPFEKPWALKFFNNVWRKI
jgi:hypothetical protein